MSNFLVETKNEYTIQLLNIISPLIFEGIQAIYKEAQHIATEDDILKIFQTFLKRIPKWNQLLIEKETDRIINNSQSFNWLNDLIRATLKANLIILMYNPTLKIQPKLDPSYYQYIKTTDFIHKVYIECAREFWNNPYLFFHIYPPIEIKRNQRDSIVIIKECIKEALRKMLPVKHILQIYLGEDIEVDNTLDDFEKVSTEANEKNLKNLVKKDLAVLELKPELKPELKHNTCKNTKLETKLEAITDTSPDFVLDKKPETITNSVQETSKITNNFLDMLDDNKNDIISSTDTTDGSPIQPIKSTIDEHTIGSRILNIINENTESTLKEQGNIDDRIKNLIKKDLENDSDIETSLNYIQEPTDHNYKEVFSNSNIVSDKTKFFNNYLQLF